MTKRDPLSHVIGTCAAQVGAIATPILSPLIIGGLIAGLGVGEMEAGSLITAELLVIGITSILLAPMMARVPHHLLAMGGAIVLFLGHLLAAESGGLDELYTWRILAGIGGGCLVATVNAAIARALSPTRLYGLAWAAGYSVTAMLAVLVTRTGETVGFDTVYQYLAFTVVLILPLLWLVPRHGEKKMGKAFPAAGIISGALLMLGIFLICIAMMIYYAFLGLLAVRINASAAQIGWIIAFAQVAGIIGGLLAAPVAGRLGVLRGLLLTSTLHVLAIAVAIFTPGVVVLGIAAFFEAVLFIIMTPLMLTLAAQIDEKGRWAASAGGVFTLSTAFGPMAGAVLIEHVGYHAIAWVQVLATIPALLIFVRVGKMPGVARRE